MKKNRSTLKESFKRGDIPTDTDFADLIDSMVNQEDDQLSKPGGTAAVKVAASGEEQALFDFYSAGALCWKIAQKPNANPGLNFSEMVGTTLTSRFFMGSGTGNIGLGTTTPGAKLEVIGTAAINDGNGYAVKNNRMAVGSLTIGSTSQNYGGGAAWSGNTAGLLLETRDNTEIMVHDSGQRLASLLYYEGGGANRISIGRDTGSAASPWGAIGSVILNGNVGVGTSTPSARLEVNGNIKVGGNSTMSGSLQVSGQAASSFVGNVGIGTTAPGAKLDVNGDIRAAGIASTGALTVSGAGGSSFVGNLGIGTTAPTVKLDVRGDVKVSGQIETGTFRASKQATFVANVAVGSASAVANLEVSGGVMVSGNLVTSTFSASKDVAVGNNLTIAGITKTTNLNVGGELIATGRASADTMQATGTGSSFFNGKVGIGIENPAEKLEVVGNIKAASITSSGALTVSGAGASSFIGKLGIGIAAPTTTLDVSGDVKVSGNIETGTFKASKAATFDADVTVSGIAKAANMELSGDLIVSGKIGTSTFSASKAATFAADVTVSGTTKAANMELSGGLTVFGKASTATLNVSGNASTATLNVSGDAAFLGNVSISAPTKNLVLNLAGDMTMSGILNGPLNHYLKAQFTLSGGGTITWDGLSLRWSSPFKAICMGNKQAFSERKVEIPQPANGSPLSVGSALYAIHELRGGNAVVLKTIPFTEDITVPNNWILIAVVADDDQSVKLGTGLTLSKNSEAYKGSPFPPGMITMWYGEITAIPLGWALCDGTIGTPDLRDRFIVGAGGNYLFKANGGAATHTLTVGEMPTHNHNNGEWNLLLTANDISTAKGFDHSGGEPNIQFPKTILEAGGSQPHNNLPPYYALAYIMKL